jgi:hypothetical protein
MTEFWEEAFKDKQEMWGNGYTQSAVNELEEFGSVSV